MKVGITYYAEPSLFGSSRGQSALFLAEALEVAGISPVLVSIGAMDWWPDATTLQNRFPRIHAKDVATAGLDLFVDIDALAAPFLRTAAGCRVAALFRGSLSFQQLERANYMNPSAQYTLEGVDEIWAYDVLNPVNTLPSLQTLFGDRPVRHVPFVWSPLCLKALPLQHMQHNQNEKVQLVIAEGNRSSASNCIVPFVGVCRWLNETRNPRVAKSLCIQNAKHLETDAYFQRNIASNVKGNVAIEYKERVPYIALQETPSLVISHLRFQAMRPGLFDLAWLGVPFVHNSPFLQKTGLAGNFYEDSSLEGMTAAIEEELQETSAENAAAAERKRWAETVCSPAAAKSKLLQLLQQPLPLQHTQQKPLSLLQRQQAAPLSSPTSPLHHPFPSKKILRIGFTDMWEGFAPDDNWFLDLLQQTAVFLGHKEVMFLGVDGKEEECELLMFGPFGNEWEFVSPEIPKVFFSGERIGDARALVDPRISLFLTHSTIEDDSHMRVPLWLMFLNWFSPQPHLQRNPNSLPWKWVLGGDGDGEEKNKKGGDERDFCAFVVSNPTNHVRNAAFDTLNAYKPVASGGAYRNTIGGPIYHLYGGGGGGDVAKHAFLKKHKFCICYENSLAPGYVTEKLLHAKLAGCVPLYWGAAEAAADFDPAGFVNLNGKEEDLLQVVRELEANPGRLQQMAATPALDAARLQKARETVFAVGRRLLQLCGLLQEVAEEKPANVVIDPSVSKSMKITAVQPAATAATAAKSPLFVTFATKAYLSSLETVLHSWKALHKSGEEPQAIAYLGHDVSKDAEELLRSTTGWVTYRRLPAESPVAGFPDFFEPKMFGWKLWILKTICEEDALVGRLVLYSDSGATWIDFPKQMLETAEKAGICLLYDTEEKNRGWCSAEMVREMGINEKELGEQQLMAAFQAFVAGAPLAVQFYREAFAWGSKRSCLFGPYVAGKDASGNFYGHRHDQSILGILSLRHNVQRIAGQPVANIQSLRKAYQKAAAVYHHRGHPVRHQRVLPGVDDIWVVSLDRRADRFASWKEAHPEMAPVANRLCAVDGKTLALTPALYTLFEQNDFHWKKSVVGCALSHILAWCQLVSEHPDVQNYLIFEDDHRFKDPAWPTRFEAAMRQAPADAELLYFGGVLPGNKEMYRECVEPVNDIWGTIRPNNLFTGENGPVIPLFHFCAYSYLLTRKGAEKLLAMLRQGCGTSIDHFLGWPAFGLKKYVMRDLMATCFQEEDPIYVNSQFDDMKRVDSFDSDIWNNNQCFTANGFPKRQSQAPLWKCITDVLHQAPANIQTHRTLREKAVNGIKQMQVFTYRDDTAATTPTDLMETPWLTQLYPGISFQPFSLQDVLAAPDPWFLFARPNLDFWNSVAGELEKHKKGFSILHLSDEGCLDDVGAYASPFCKKVIRNYVRPEVDTKKVCLLPLGFACAPSASAPASAAFQNRELVWSFHGTRWFDRAQQLAALTTDALQPYSLKFQDTFLDPSMTPKKEFSTLLLRTKFAPIPRGNNCETFRLYEALEHGCIPLYVRTPGDEPFWTWLTKHVELVELRSWDAAASLAAHLLANPAKAEMYRQGLCKQWNQWKLECRLFL